MPAATSPTQNSFISLIAKGSPSRSELKRLSKKSPREVANASEGEVIY